MNRVGIYNNANGKAWNMVVVNNGSFTSMGSGGIYGSGSGGVIANNNGFTPMGNVEI